jgi:hypothetical protein
MEAGQPVDTYLRVRPLVRTAPRTGLTFLPSSKRPFGVRSMISGALMGYVGGSSIRRWYSPILLASAQTYRLTSDIPPSYSLPATPRIVQCHSKMSV